MREGLKVKRAVASRIADHAPADAVIASCTSGLPGSTFLPHLPDPERALVPLVELCRTGVTSQDMLDRTRTLLTEAGMKPVILKNEIDGLLLKRLQYTVVAEALHLVGEGLQCRGY